MKKFNTPLFKNLCNLMVITITLTCFGSQRVSASWIEEGPGPILGGNNVELPNRPQAGAINAIVPHPKNANIVYVGTVNGGIWVTKNATDQNPLWKPLTDLKLPGLSIASLAMSPLDSKTLFAGTGSTSSFNNFGSPGFGIARSTNEGKTWRVLARDTFNGKTIISILPTALEDGKVVFAATLDTQGGVFRSHNGGHSFERISGKPKSNLPNQGVSSLVADPSHPKRLYAGVPKPIDSVDSTGNEGIYRSDDGGKQWTLINQGLTNFSSSLRILLAVHANQTIGTNVIYAMIIAADGSLAGVFRSENQGDLWTSMAPLPSILPGLQGRLHGAIVADPVNPNVVFIAGDRQSGPFPNANGCNNFSANVFRGDASLLPGDPWQIVVCNGANGTSPHPDSRMMVFDSNGNILQANDGGIYRLNEPNNPVNRIWSSVLGNIRPCEIHSVAYDSLSNVVFGGSQDNGTPIQLVPGNFLAFDVSGGDGAIVAVDSDQAAHPGISFRYTGSQFLSNFRRSTFDATNTLITSSIIPLLIVSGPGTGNLVYLFDPDIQFYTPYVLNAIDPSRMLLGTSSIYESFDRGDTVNNLGFQGQPISCLAYGGRRNGNNQPDVFYAGTRPTTALPSRILKRVNIGDPISTLVNYPGAAVLSIAMDPENYQRIFVADSLGEVWTSSNGGITWSKLTGNLKKLTRNTVNVLVAFTEDGKTKVAAGGLGGVFLLDHSSKKDPEWKRLNRKLPHGDVFDLHFDQTNNLLVAGILGRGIWIISLNDEKK